LIKGSGDLSKSSISRTKEITMRNWKFSKSRVGLFVVCFCIFFLFLDVAVGASGQPAETAKDAPVTIEYATFLNPKDKGPRQSGLAEAIKNFEAENPNITVNAKILPWSDIPKILIMEANAGKGPDAIRVSTNTLKQIADAGALEPLDSYVKDWPDSRKKDFLAPWDLTTVNGKKMSFPLEHRAQVLFYRDDMLKKAGLPSPPKSWDDLKRVSEALTQGELAGVIIGLARKNQASNLMQWTIPYMWAAGGAVCDDSGKGTFASPAGEKVYQLFYDMVHKHKMPYETLNMSVEEITLGMKASTIAVCNQGSHRVWTSRMGEGVGDNLKSAPLPGITSAKPAPAYITGWGLGINAASKKKAAAWKFVEFRLRSTSQLSYAKTGGEMPAVASVFLDSWFGDNPKGKELKSWADYIKNHSKVFPNPLQYLQMADNLAVAVARIIAEKEAIPKVLKETQEAYNKLAGF
jgi:ABC-type glycerol-3-phosphate transport system substrate-binding protein